MRRVVTPLLCTPSARLLLVAQRLLSCSNTDLQYSQPPRSRGGFRGRGGRGSAFGRGGRDGGYNEYGGNNYNNSRDNFGGGGGGGGRGRGRGRYGDSRGGRPMRRREDYLAENVEKLYMLKRNLREVKSEKARADLFREAKWIIIRARVDPSTHDEKSVSVLLNCAAAFRCGMNEGVEQAVEWMRNNLDGLTPQNVALFANALGVFHTTEYTKIVQEEILPVVKNIYKEMRPVEVVMILQACRRLRITADAELLIALVRFLEPSLAEMPVLQLTTMANALCFHPLREKDPEEWQSVVNTVVTKIFTQLDHLHSKDVVAFAQDIIYLNLSQEQIVKVLKRLTETANFHSDEQIGDILVSLQRIYHHYEEGTIDQELSDALMELKQALSVRLERVATFVDINTAAKILRCAPVCKFEIKQDILAQIAKEIVNVMSYRRFRFMWLYAFLKEAKRYKFPSAQTFNYISDYLCGIRVPRDVRRLKSNRNAESDDESQNLSRYNRDGKGEADHRGRRENDDNDEVNRHERRYRDNRDANEARNEDDNEDDDRHGAFSERENGDVVSEEGSNTSSLLNLPYSKILWLCVSMRLSLEDIYANLDATPPNSLTITLPKHLEDAVHDAETNVLIRCVLEIAEATENCPLRNVRNDNVIINEAKRRVEMEGKAAFTKNSVNFLRLLKTLTEGKERFDFITKLLEECDSEELKSAKVDHMEIEEVESEDNSCQQ